MKIKQSQRYTLLMWSTQSCQVLQDLTRELPSLSHQGMNSGNLSEQHCSHYCCGRKNAEALTHPEPAWLGMWQFHPNTSEEGGSLVLPGCTVLLCTCLNLFLTFLLCRKGEQWGVLLCTHCFPSLDRSSWEAAPAFLAWSLAEPGGWDVQKRQGPASVRREGEEIERDLGPATVQLLQYTANSQFLLNLFKSEEFQLVITSLVEGSVAAQLWKDRAQQLALGEQSGAPWFCCQFCFKPSLMCLPSAMQTWEEGYFTL